MSGYQPGDIANGHILGADGVWRPLQQQVPVVFVQRHPDEKSPTTFALLAVFLGVLGVHRFYLGNAVSGAVMLLLWLLAWPLALALVGFVIWFGLLGWAIIDACRTTELVARANRRLGLG